MTYTPEEILFKLGMAPRRVVSLVPSYTESLFQLGFGQAVVGVTDYCTSPENELGGIARVGGTKDARVEEILSLAPDLVIANQEENNPQTVTALEQAGLPVWLSFPKVAQEAVDVLWGMVDLFSDQTASLRVRFLEDSLDLAVMTQDSYPALRTFCPIWQGKQADGSPWWMTFSGETYPSDVLGLFGAKNIFAERRRRYPLEADLGQAAAEDPAGRDTRYPCVTREEVLAGNPELILLPDEPYPFDEGEVERLVAIFANTSAVKNGRVIRIDGRLIFWYGVRLAAALQELPELAGSW